MGLVRPQTMRVAEAASRLVGTALGTGMDSLDTNLEEEHVRKAEEGREGAEEVVLYDHYGHILEEEKPILGLLLLLLLQVQASPSSPSWIAQRSP